MVSIANFSMAGEDTLIVDSTSLRFGTPLCVTPRKSLGFCAGMGCEDTRIVSISQSVGQSVDALNESLEHELHGVNLPGWSSWQ